MKKEKTALIFFGELRTFEYVVPNLFRLNDVDIFLSTWSISKRHNSFYNVDENMILDILPNIKKMSIISPHKISDYNNKNNAWKMYWHWKHAINNLVDIKEYDNLILHRCDLLSNWHSILDLNIEQNTLYLHHGNEPYYSTEINNFWINDYYVFGKSDIVKRFVNTLDDDEPYPHYSLWQAVDKHKFNIKKYVLQGSLVRDNNIKDTIKFISSNLTVNNLSKLIGPNNC